MPRPTLAEVVRTLGVEPRAIRLISRRHNAHWLVRAGDRRLVLRRFGPVDKASMAWEMEAAAAVADLGWPAPRALSGPRRIGEATCSLFPFLEGRSLGPSAVTPQKYRRLGRLLADFHAATTALPCPPQRPGWSRMVDGALPEHGGSARRAALLAVLAHADADLARTFGRAAIALEERDLPGLFADSPQRVVHGDFSPWNLRLKGGRLTGLLDFEMAHVDVTTADLAFARRGSHDAVVEGYLETARVPSTQLAALDGLWKGALLSGVWRMLQAAEPAGSVTKEAFAWHAQQLRKTRPFAS